MSHGSGANALNKFMLDTSQVHRCVPSLRYYGDEGNKFYVILCNLLASEIIQRISFAVDFIVCPVCSSIRMQLRLLLKLDSIANSNLTPHTHSKQFLPKGK